MPHGSSSSSSSSPHCNARTCRAAATPDEQTMHCAFLDPAATRFCSYSVLQFPVLQLTFPDFSSALSCPYFLVLLFQVPSSPDLIVGYSASPVPVNHGECQRSGPGGGGQGVLEKKYFSGNYYVKFGHFSAKKSCKIGELC